MKMPKKSVSVLLSLIMVLGVFFSVPFSFGKAAAPKRDIFSR